MNYHLTVIALLLQTQVASNYLVSGFSTLHQQAISNSHRSSWICCQKKAVTTSLHSTNGDHFERLTVAGASVSSLGFLVVVNSTYTSNEQQPRDIAFPIQLTSSSSGKSPDISIKHTDGDNNVSISMPSLFQENLDQTSVTTPEALTFLQLINGVDMATPILPPDTLSLLCVWYAFLLDCETKDDSGVFVVEDELGLDSSTDANALEYYPALEYIRSFVQTMMSGFGSAGKTDGFLNLSQWQRGKVRLPSVRLRGVRVEGVDVAKFVYEEKQSLSEREVDTIPLKFVLECDVDEDSKILEVPLYSVPNFYDVNVNDARLSHDVQLSKDILKNLSHNFNTETSASFIALSLFHRYRKSKGAMLRVSQHLLKQLADLQQKATSEKYCWLGSEDLSIYKMIRAMGLSSFRTLLDLQAEDKRVLGYLEKQNFDRSASGGGVSSNTDTSSNQNKRAIQLTLEQLAMQQKLKSAWKVATEKNDAIALERIQKAMQEFEQQLEASQKKETSLQMIKQAMREEDPRDDEEAVSLITELEDAINEDVDP
jgi:hypothetical protein